MKGWVRSGLRRGRERPQDNQFVSNGSRLDETVLNEKRTF